MSRYGLIDKMVFLIEEKQSCYSKWMSDPANNSDEFFKLLNLIQDMNILGRHIFPSFSGFPMPQGWD